MNNDTYYCSRCGNLVKMSSRYCMKCGCSNSSHPDNNNSIASSFDNNVSNNSSISNTVKEVIK